MSGAMPTQESYSIQVDFDVPATMRDGTVLRANIYRPVGNGAFPVLLARMPYGKDLLIGSAGMNPTMAARRGYIVVIQDTRGRFTSDGDYHPMLDERADGYDSVEWAAELPGSSGVVGMTGGSYVGFTQWAAAREHPAHLKVLFPLVTWADSFDGPTLRGGAVELGLSRNWVMLNALDTAVRRARPSGDPRRIGGALMQMAAELDQMPTAGYAELPITGFGRRRNVDYFDTFDEGIARRTDDALTDLTSVANGYDALDLPAYHMGGWYDIFLGGTLRNFTELSKRGKAPQKLIIGPWTHTSQEERIGAMEFGLASSAGLINMQADLYTLGLRWFDYWLKGIPNGVVQEPAVQIFVMGINRWRNEAEWPLARAVPTPYYLHSNGHANTLHGDGALSDTLPAVETVDHYVYDPLNPVPTVGGASMMHAAFQNGPQDQRPIEQRDDMLVFTSAPLAQPLEVTGPITVTLYAATDAPDTDFVARLVDVHPDGFARNLTDGIIRGRMRNGIANEALLTPGEVNAFTIDLWATSNVFLPGHRIRLDISSSSFPRWDRNLNTAAPYAEGSEAVTARQSILHDREHPSHVLLPVIPA